MDMVHLLLDFIESERDSIWQTHIETFCSMLPYYRSFDHNKYFKWGLAYFNDMILKMARRNHVKISVFLLI